MKIRTGFVSNSSSSSFCLYGAKISHSEDEKIYNLLKRKDDPDEVDCVIEYLWDMDKNISAVDDSEGYECYYVGIYPESQDDNQKHIEWKQEIETFLMEKLKGVKMDIGWHEGIIYN